MGDDIYQNSSPPLNELDRVSESAESFYTTQTSFHNEAKRLPLSESQESFYTAQSNLSKSSFYSFSTVNLDMDQSLRLAVRSSRREADFETFSKGTLLGPAGTATRSVHSLYIHNLSDIAEEDQSESRRSTDLAESRGTIVTTLQPTVVDDILPSQSKVSKSLDSIFKPITRSTETKEHKSEPEPQERQMLNLTTEPIVTEDTPLNELRLTQSMHSIFEPIRDSLSDEHQHESETELSTQQMTERIVFPKLLQEMNPSILSELESSSDEGSLRLAESLSDVADEDIGFGPVESHHDNVELGLKERTVSFAKVLQPLSTPSANTLKPSSFTTLTEDEELEYDRNVPEQRTKKMTKHKKQTTVERNSSTDTFVPKMSQIQMLSTEQSRKQDKDNNEPPTNLMLGDAFIYMIIPPDGGYGWVIVFMSFLAQVVVDGLIFAIGIIMPHMAADLQVTPAKIVLVVSIQIGPISSATINKYGFRPVCLIGSFLSVCAISLASFSPDLTTLILFYSIIGGPSLSMIWVSSQLIIGYYFERLRPIAYGLCVSGAGAGILMGAALNSAVVTHIGWRHNLQIYAALLVLVFFLGFTYLEVPPTKIGRIYDKESDTDTEEIEQVDLINTFRYSRAYSVTLSKLSISIDKPRNNYDDNRKPNFFQRMHKKCCPCLVRREKTRELSGVKSKNYIVQADLIDRQDLYYTGPADYKRYDAKTSKFELPPFEITKDSDTRAINYNLSMMHTARPSTISHKSYAEIKQVTKHPLAKFISPLNWLPKKIVSAFQLLFDFRLLLIEEFLILISSAFLFPMGFNIPFVYSTVRAEIRPEYRKLISPAIGLSNFIFRIFSGFIAYKYREYTTIICGSGMTLGGIIVFVSAFYGRDVIWFQFVYAFIYGIAPAFYATLRAIIYVRALGLEKLTNAFGLTAIAMGLGVFIGTTVAGNLNENTGNYDASFIFAGCCIMLSGILKLLLPFYIQWRHPMGKPAENETQNAKIVESV